MANTANLLYPPPDKGGWDRFWFDNAQEHFAVERAINQVLGIAQVNYTLYPVFPGDLDSFLRNHQSAHDRWSQLLGIPGEDLSNLDFNDKTQVDAWLSHHHWMHLGVASRLGVPYV